MAVPAGTSDTGVTSRGPIGATVLPVILRLLDRHPLRFAGAGLVILGVMTVVILLTLSAGIGDDQLGAQPDPLDVEVPPTPEPEPEPAPEPEPEPEPEPRPVDGVVELVGVQDLAPTGTGLFQPGSSRDAAIPADGPAVDAFVAAIAVQLDEVLTAANLDQDLTASAEGLTGDVQLLDLGSLDDPVHHAHYAVTVATLGAPQWGEVRLTAERADGRQNSVILVFAPGEDSPTLLAAESVSADANGTAEGAS